MACNANWDLVAERMGPEPDPPPLERRWSPPVLQALAELEAVMRRTASIADDKLLEKLLDDLVTWHDELVAAPDEYEQLRLLSVGTPKGSVKHGRKDNWPTECPADDGPRPR